MFNKRLKNMPQQKTASKPQKMANRRTQWLMDLAIYDSIIKPQ